MLDQAKLHPLDLQMAQQAQQKEYKINFVKLAYKQEGSLLLRPCFTVFFGGGQILGRGFYYYFSPAMYCKL